MTDRLRVFALIDGLGFGGAEMLLAEFARAAPQAGIDLEVGYLREKDGNPATARLRELGIEPRPVPIDGLLSPSSMRSVHAAVRDVAPDVLHTHLGYSDLLGGIAARRLGVPAVCTLHVMEWGSGLREGTKSLLFARVRRASMQRIVAVSEAARAYYLGRAGGDPEQVVTLRNGVAGDAQPGAGAAVRAGLGLAPDDLVVATVSVLRPGKGHEVAAGAVERLRERHPNLRLLVVGDGPSRAEIADLVRPLGDAAVMAGHREDVMAVLDAVDVLVHPSHADAFPTVLLEAMAASVPVVATRVGGIGEIVVPGSTGALLEPPPDVDRLVAALEPLLADAGLRRRQGEAGRARFDEEHAARVWVQRTRSLYADAIAAARR